MTVRAADDFASVGRLLDAFNREFDEPTPGAEVLAERMRRLCAGDTRVLVVGEPAHGIAVLRLRPSIWSAGLEAYLAELYVEPARRRRGDGRALLEAAMALARSEGADYMDLNTDDEDVAAHALYRACGFTRTSNYYERDL